MRDLLLFFINIVSILIFYTFQIDCSTCENVLNSYNISSLETFKQLLSDQIYTNDHGVIGKYTLIYLY
jgi:hypothetical protein